MLLTLLYYYSFVFLSYVAKNSIRVPYKRVRFETIMCFMLLFVFFGFRDLPVLNDTAHYYEHFYDVLHDGNISFSNIFNYDKYDRFSLGFLIYERFIGALFGHPYMIICISALIITISFLYFARAHTNKVSFLVFMCLIPLLSIYSGIRQGLATCIFLFALISLNRNKIFVFYLLAILALSFHTSAIILFIVPILKRIPLNKLTIFLTVAGTLAASIGINYLVEITGLSRSIYYEVNQERGSLPIGSILNFLILFFITVVAYRIKVRLSLKNNSTASLYWWISILTLFFSLLDTLFPILGRFCMYFNIVVYTLFLYYISKIKHFRIRKIISTLVICFLMLRMGVILAFRPEWYHIDSYAFYDFTKTMHETRLGY